MEQVPLTAQIRDITGRKVKKLRREGLIPAHVFGHQIPTVHVQVKISDFSEVFEKVGETGIVDLNIDGLPDDVSAKVLTSAEASAKSGNKRPVMVRNIQIHPLTEKLVHIDFYQVNLSEKVTVNVPLEIIGESPAVEKKIGLLLTPINELEIEALPADIPESIQVDISNLENIDDEIKVQQLPINREKIEVKSEDDLVVVQIGELVTKEMEEVAAEMEAEAAEASAEATTEEGAVADGEEAAEGTEGETTEESPATQEEKKEE